MFGPYDLHREQIFYESNLSHAFVNLKPIVPGHVLVTPIRVVERFADMTSEEVNDLWKSVHQIGPKLERHFGCCALNLAIQDGVASGQSVPHVHVHILPRREGDFKRNDDIYEHLEQQNLDTVMDTTHIAMETTTAVDPAGERVPRTATDMAREAAMLRSLFPDNQPRCHQPQTTDS